MPTALVTGSAGFVGQRMIPALRARGYDEIHCIDITAGPGLQMDVRDWFRLDQEFQRYDLVVHLAAVVGGRALIEGNPLAVAVDLAIDAEMFQWAVRTGQPHILYFSSSAAYPVYLQGHRYGQGGTEDVIDAEWLTESEIDLDDLSSPDLSYGLSKLVGEYQAREARKHGVKVTVARPFSGTGPTQTLDYPVPSIIDRAVRGEDPIDIWSDSVRDFVHIDDLVDVALTAVELGIEEPFNIGTGRGVSFSEVATLAAKAMGYLADVRVLSDKPAGVAYRVADPTFMQSWYSKPLRPIEQIVAEMVQARAEALANA